MTRATNARLAGLMFLLYIAMGLLAMSLFPSLDGAQGAAAKLAAIAAQAPRLRLSILLSQFMLVDALVLAVALYALTRDQDRDLALLALGFRIAEGVIGAVCLLGTLGLLWVATGGGGEALDAGSTKALGTLLLKVEGWSPTVGGFAFACGSTIYAWLFLRGRSIPAPLACLGLFASVLLVALLPAQLVGSVKGMVASLMWLPMLVFEVVLGLWLLIKGCDLPAENRPAEERAE